MVCEGRNYCMPKAYMLFDVTRLLCSKRRTVAPSHRRIRPILTCGGIICGK